MPTIKFPFSAIITSPLPCDRVFPTKAPIFRPSTSSPKPCAQQDDGRASEPRWNSASATSGALVPLSERWNRFCSAAQVLKELTARKLRRREASADIWPVCTPFNVDMMSLCESADRNERMQLSKRANQCSDCWASICVRSNRNFINRNFGWGIRLNRTLTLLKTRRSKFCYPQ